MGIWSYQRRQKMAALVAVLMVLQLLVPAGMVLAEGNSSAIMGVVTDYETDNPLKGVTVRLHIDGSAWNTIEAETDISGSYTIEDVPAGEHYLHFIKLTCDNYEPYETAPFLVEPNTIITIDRALLPYSVKGNVTYGDEPVEGAFVSTNYGQAAYTNSDGYYQLTGVPEGEGLITVNHKWYENITEDDEIIYLFDGEKPSVVDIALEQTVNSIVGQVICGDSGDPLSNVNVRDSDWQYSDTTDEFGFFALTGLDAGTYQIVFNHGLLYDEKVIEGIDLVDGEQTKLEDAVELASAAMGEVSGLVTCDDSDDPINNVWVSVSGNFGSKGAYTGNDGFYTVENVPAGTVNVDFSKAGYSVKTEEGVEVEDGGILSVDAQLTPTPTGNLMVTVKDDDEGKPVYNADVQVSGDWGSVGGYSDESGVIIFENRPAGDVTVNINHQLYGAVEETEVIVSGETKELEVEMTLEVDSGSVNGAVTDIETGEPVTDVDVGVVALDDNWVEGNNWEWHEEWVSFLRTDEFGGFDVTGVPAGNIYIFYNHNYYDYYEVYAGELVADGSMEHDAELTPRDVGAVYGKITDALTGEPMEGVQIYCWTDHGSFNTDSDIDGNFQLDSIPVGNWDFSFRYDGIHIGNREFKVNYHEETEENVSIVPIKGNVTSESDENGDNLEEIQVTLYGYNNNWDSWQYMGQVYTDNNGNYGFYFVDVNMSWFFIDFSDPGRLYENNKILPFYLAEGTGAVKDVSLTARELGSVSGTVSDGVSGDGLADVSVEIDYYNVSKNTNTDENGLFELDGIPFGDWNIELSHCAYIPKEIEVSIGEETDSVDIELWKSGIAGIITDGDSGEPVHGAYVEAVADETVYSSAYTRSTGQYTLAELVYGKTYTVNISHDNYHARSEEVAVENGHFTDGSFDIDPRYVSGKVADSAGEGISGVSVYTESINGTVYSDETDDNGEYKVLYLPAGNWFLNFGHENYYDKEIMVDVDGDVEDFDVQLPLSKGHIEGVVTETGSGDALEGINVSLQYYSGSWANTGGEDFTDAEGAFSFGYLVPGFYRIIVADPAFADETSSAFYVEEAEVTTQNASLNRLHYGAITGRVVDGNDEPMGEVFVRLLSNGNNYDSLSTEEDGLFNFENVPVGQWSVVIEHDGYHYFEEEEVAVVKDETFELGDVKLAALTYGDISGVVKDAVDEDVLEGAYVSVESEYFHDDAVTDETGSYTFTGIPAGDYTVTFAHDWYLDKEIQVTVEADGTTDGDVMLDRQRYISGKVTDDDGEAVANVVVRLSMYLAYYNSWNILTDTTTNENGEYIFRDIPLYDQPYDAYWFMLDFRHNDYHNEITSPFFLDIDEDAEKNAVLEYDETPKGSLSGLVTDDETEEGIPGLRVRVRDANWNYHTVYTDEEGSYEIENIPAGEVDVDFQLFRNPYHEDSRLYSYYSQTLEAEILAEEQLELDVALTKLVTGDLSGSITDAGMEGEEPLHQAGDPINNARVQLDSLDYDDLNFIRTWTNQNGDYSLNFVPAGNWKVTISHGDYNDVVIEEIEITEDELLVLDRTMSLSKGYILGNITDSDSGYPLQGATVGLYRYTGWGWSNVGDINTDRDGYYQSMVNPGFYYLSVNHPAYDEERTLIFYLNEGTEQVVNRELEILGEQGIGGGIYGVVTDSLTGDPLADVKIGVEGLIPLEDPVIFNNNNIGGVNNYPSNPTVFTLDNPRVITYIETYHYFNHDTPPGTIWLEHSDGSIYGPWQASGRVGQGGVENAYWEVWPNVSAKAGSYTINVSSPETWSHNWESGNRGFAKVEGQTIQGSVYTDANGEFVLNSIPAGKWDIVVEADSYLDELAEVTVIDGEAVKIDFNLNPWYISGNVTDSESDEPLNGYNVNLYKYSISGGSYSWIANKGTDEEGYFTFGNIEEEGWYYVAVNSYYHQDYESEKFYVKEGEVVDDLNIVLDPESQFGSLSVNVVDGSVEGKDAIEGVRLEYGSGTYYTDRNGNILISGIPVGDYQILFKHFNFYEKELEDVTVSYNSETELEVELLPKESGAITGTVTDAVTGDPIRQVDVYTELIEIEGTAYSSAISAITNINGEFTLNEVPAGEWQLYFSNNDYENKVKSVTVVKDDEVIEDAILQPVGGTVSGTVTLEDSDPSELLENVTVRLYEYGNYWNYRTAYTDEDGNYQFRFVDKGFYYLEFSDNDYVNVSTLHFYVEANEDVTYDKSLLPIEEIVYGSVYGTVVDADGETVNGANINIVGYGSSVESNEFGEFLFTSVPVGEQVLSVNHQYYTSLQATVEVEEDRIAESEIVLEDWYITGNVSGEEAISGAKVSLYSYTAYNNSWNNLDSETYTCDEGFYTLGDLTENTWYIVVFNADDYSRETVDVPFMVSAGEVKVIDASLAASIVSGAVTNEAGEPIEGVVVRGIQGSTFRTGTFTDEDGKYELSIVSDGDWSFRFVHPDYHTTTYAKELSGNNSLELDIELKSAQFGDISGIVIDRESGEPLNNINVRLGYIALEGTDFGANYNTYTNQDGAFKLNGVPAGDWEILFDDYRFYNEEHQVSITDGEETVLENIMLRPKYGKICGTVTAGEDDLEEDLQGVAVRLEVLSESNYWDYYSYTETNSEGYYSFGSLDPGHYRLRFTKNDYLTENTSSFFVDRGEIREYDLKMVSIEDVPKGSIYGIVTDTESEEPLSQVNVSVAVENSEYYALTNEYGEYVLQDIPVGTWDMSFQHSQYADKDKEVAVEECQASTVDAALQPWYLTGNITASGSDDALDNVYLELRGYHESNDSWQAVATNSSLSDGDYRLGGLKNPDYSWYILRAARTGFETFVSNPFRADDLAVTVKDLSLTAFEYGNISGLIYENTDDESIVPVSGARVRAYTNVGEMIAFTDEAGSFALNDVPVGLQYLDIRHDDYHNISMADIEVIGGEENELDNIYLNSAVYGSLSGYVNDKVTGLPVSGVSVSTESIEGFGVYSGTTNNDGYFEVSGVPVGEWFITASHNNYYDSDFSVSITENGISDAELELNPKVGVVEGAVFNEAGDLLLGINVALESMVSYDDGMDPDYDGLPYTTGGFDPTVKEWKAEQYEATDEIGFFSFENVTRGYYRLVYTSPAYLNSISGIFFVDEGEVVEVEQEMILKSFAGIEGKVVDADGSPVENASVRLYDGIYTHYDSTDVDGAYSFSDVYSGTHNIIISHNHYINKEVPVEIDNDAKLVAVEDVVLLPWFLSGNVTGDDDEVVENARIRLIGYDSSADNEIENWSVLRTVYTDEDGYYTIGGFEGLDSSCYHWFALQVSKKGYSVLVTLPFTVPAETETVKDQVLELLNTGTISGTIKDSETEDVLAGAKVRTENIYGFGYETVFSDENGEFLMEDIPVGSWDITFSSEDYYYLIETIDVENGEDTDLGNVQLEKIAYGSISGTVTNNVTGEPLPGVNILTDSIPEVVGSFVYTDSDGFYLIENVPVGTRMLEASMYRYHGLQSDIAVAEGELVENDFELAPNHGAISGMVTDLESGDTLHSINVTLQKLSEPYYSWSNWRWSYWSDVSTDDQGTYSFDYVEPGMYRLTFNHNNYLYAETEEFYVGEGYVGVEDTVVKDMAMELWKPGDVSGKVTDSVTGGVVEGATVEIVTNGYGTFSAETDVEGAFMLEEIPSDLYQVIVYHDDYHEREAEVEVKGGTVVTLDLQILPLGVISGIVTDEDGEPIADVEVSVKGYEYYYDYYYEEERIKAYTDENGLYELEGITEGITTVRFRHIEYLPVTHKVNVFGGLVTELDAEMVSKTYGTVNGSVVCAEGEPLAGVSVTAENVDMDHGTDNRSISTDTDADGNYLFEKLHTGNIEITFHLNGYHVTSRFIHLEEGEDVTVDAELLEVDGVTADVRIAVKNADNAPVEGIRIRMLRQDNVQAHVYQEILGWSNEMGIFESNLPIGYYRAEFSDVIPRDGGSIYEDHSFYVEVTEDGLEREVALKEAEYITGQVTGVVKDAKTGEPVPFATVRHSVVTDSEGRYTLHNISEGLMWLNCRHEDYKNNNRNVFVSFDEDEIFELDFELTPYEFGNVIGNVTYNGEPVDRVGVFYDVYASVYEGSTVMRAVADKYGDFSAEKVPTEVRYLRFVHPDHPVKMVRSDIKADDTIELDVELEDYGTLRGRVVDTQRRSIPGVLITATQKLSGETAMAVTGDDGRFFMDKVAPGTNSLTFVHDDYRFREVDVRVRMASGQAMVMSDDDDIVLDKFSSGRVEGYVVHPRSGEPSENVTVTLVVTDENGNRIARMDAWTDSEGKYIFTNVPSGKVIIGYIEPGIVVDEFRPMDEFAVDYEADFEEGDDKVFVSEQPLEGPDTELPQDEDPYTLGDVNDDGAINVTDAITVLRYVVGLIGDNDINLGAADVDNDGSVTVSDAIMILRHVVGLVSIS